MNWYEKLVRLYEVKILKKNFCDNKTRHGHDFDYLGSNDKPGFQRLVFFKCSVCDKKSYVDASGDLCDAEY